MRYERGRMRQAALTLAAARPARGAELCAA